ncbi:hypothetical protein Ocin01_09196 [Orchesella cincta]|uniref:Uncharacterized protein n=1 Tax=Orchesella cincta TaxID=48709 RepID=A0A1D2MWR7_ORCCI|nr:hypothetical protein Ocin01_09196 [Orchesella cincta]
MNTNKDQRQKRKFTLPSLQNLLIFDAEDGPLSPKAPKSPKIIKGSPNRGRLPTCSICIDDLIIFDEEPVGESKT